jgi:hypothetical protein
VRKVLVGKLNYTNKILKLNRPRQIMGPPTLLMNPETIVATGIVPNPKLLSKPTRPPLSQFQFSRTPTLFSRKWQKP